MEKDRKFRALAIAAICIAVVGVSVAYAALTASLTITGTATVDTSAAWNIRWENTEEGDVAPAVVTTPTNAETAGYITFATRPSTDGVNLTWAATFTRPGDSIQITAYAANDGTLNAELNDGTDLTIEGPLAEYFEYAMTINGKTLANQKTKILAAGSNVPVVITVTLKESITTEQWAAITAEANKTVKFTARLDFKQAADTATETL